LSFVQSNDGLPLLPINEAQAMAMALHQKLPSGFHGGSEEVYVGNQNHQVLTGLGMGYGGGEPLSLNSSTANMVNAAVDSSSLRNDIRKELVVHKAELDHYFTLQEEKMARELKSLSRKHMMGIGKALEKAFSRRMHEKDLELEKLSQRYKQLSDSVRAQTTEAQNWISVAKYNEALIAHLKSDLDRVLQTREEGFAETDPNDEGNKTDLVCRFCKGNMASVLLMPCRHLCLCRECDVVVNDCPVCWIKKSFSFEVYLS
ncbi:hypothetical protein M569_02783, partial [Genlisea aurea]